jgi:hypothetical protein
VDRTRDQSLAGRHIGKQPVLSCIDRIDTSPPSPALTGCNKQVLEKQKALLNLFITITPTLKSCPAGFFFTPIENNRLHQIDERQQLIDNRFTRAKNGKQFCADKQLLTGN